MPTTRAVLFDMGGTLITYRNFEQARREAMAEFASWFGLQDDMARVQAAFLRAAADVWPRYTVLPYYLHSDLGKDMRRASAANLGIDLTPELLERYQAFFAERQAAGGVEVRQGVYETLTELRARGVHVGIVSNADILQLDGMVAQAGVAPYCDSILCSEEAGSCKPDAGIYLEALRRAGCAPGEALFVGDTPDHDIAGANAVGLRSVLIHEQTEMGLPRGDVRADHTIAEIPEVLRLL